MDNGTINIPGFRAKKFPAYVTADLIARVANPGAYTTVETIAAMTAEIEARKTDKPRPNLYV